MKFSGGSESICTNPLEISIKIFSGIFYIFSIGLLVEEDRRQGKEDALEFKNRFELLRKLSEPDVVSEKGNFNIRFEN